MAPARYCYDLAPRPSPRPCGPQPHAHSLFTHTQPSLDSINVKLARPVAAVPSLSEIFSPLKPEPEPEPNAFEVGHPRFLRASNRRYIGLGRAEQEIWTDDFCFVQMADTQLGMLHDNKSKDNKEETEMITLAVHHINQIKPRFVVVCGDLVNAFPHERAHQAKQARDLQSILSGVDATIPLVCLCGNHDVGNSPTRASIDIHSKRFGDDYFEFFCGGVRFLRFVVGSILLRLPVASNVLLHVAPNVSCSCKKRFKHT